MKTSSQSFIAACVFAVLTALNLSAATRYVWQSSPSPGPPYTNWATAAHVIQDAVDAAQTGDSVLVAGGVYATGGRAVGTNLLVNRVAIDRAITVESLMGPEVTIIQGYQVPGTTNGDGAIRCAYLTNGASLSGFTLTNGMATAYGGGLWCESTDAFATNCVIVGNWAQSYGGGAAGGTLNNCILTGNWASSGGGAYNAVLNYCTLAGNSATNSGGGAGCATLNHCILTGNSACYGGGAGSGFFGGLPCELNNCTLTGNSARVNADRYGGTGGGVHNSTLKNCLLTGNHADYEGGGTAGGRLTNCTLTANSAGRYGGGASGFEGFAVEPSILVNCILYYNMAPMAANYYESTEWGAIECELSYCCTTPLPAPSVGAGDWDSLGNISAEPQLVNASHLSATSPCRGSGSTEAASGTDIDGEPWASPPSIGCDEYHAGAATGPLSVAIMATYTNVAVGFPVGFTALIDGYPSASVWDFADGTMATNQLFASHAWATPGDYAVTLRAYNDTYPADISATVMIHVVAQAVHYVAADSRNPVPPYTSWATAATNIQDAVDACEAGGVPGALVWVSNGVYAAGGRVAGTNWLVNRVTVDKPLRIQSIKGPQFTIIDASSQGRCVYLCDGASLSGFTLTNGTATSDWSYSSPDASGGGVWCESRNAVVTNCVLSRNSAAYHGGGAYGGTLNHCTLANNSAGDGPNGGGGGAHGSTLNHCTLSGNWAPYEGGGALWSTLSNCILSTNSAQYGGGAYTSALSECTLTGNLAESGGGACNSTLHDCSLTDNRATGWAWDNYFFDGDGGGVYWSTLDNCVLNGNSAAAGGGAYASMLNNCTLTGNRAWGDRKYAYAYGCGGGADYSSLNNCALTGNSATEAGGGAYYSTLNNSIVYFNTAPNGPNYDSGTLRYCCTTPTPGGDGNITNAPLFVDYTGGNLRLQSNSPCINAGFNYYVPGSTDLDGRPRVVGGRVDIGAYEFQPGVDATFLGWLQQYGLPTDGSADYTDPDTDGLNNWQEWCCLTDPTNALSALRLLTPQSDGTNITVRWTSVAGVSYYLLRSAHLTVPSAYRLLATNILGQAGTTSYTDTNAARWSPLFYRVGVGNYIAPPSPPPPTLTCQYDGGTRMLQLSWEAPDAKLQEAATPNGPWQTVTTAVSPYRTATAYPRRFYRLILPAPGKKWLTVAAVTMTSQTNTAANLQTFYSYMEQAASNGVDLVVFPEVALQQCPAWGSESYTPTAQEMVYMRQTAEMIPGQSTSNVVAKAKELNLFVVFGMTEKDGAGLLYNANVFLGPDGVIGKHRKSFFIANDASIWRLGTGYEVLESPIGRIGLMICIELWSDGNFPGPLLAGLGADLLVSSSAWWTSGANSWAPVTVENAIRGNRWHVASQQVGAIGHVQVYGHSLIIDPKGTIVCDTGTGAGLVRWATDILIDARTP
jgi:predicted amidohydrolase